jgi:hypothetical protein
MRFRTYALGAAMVLALGGCAQTGVTTVGQIYPQYRTAYSNYALNGHDVFVVVEGGGYGTDQTAFRQAVLDTMQHYRAGMNTRFTSTPQRDYNRDYKVVMLFNGPVTAQAGALCREPAQYAAIPPTTVGGDTNVLAAFCWFDAPLTEVSGRAAGVTTVGDARFASLIQQTMTDLFPTRDERPDRDSDHGGGGGDIP